LTNLPNADLGNATGVLPLANGGTGATNASGARSALELGSAATNAESAFQPASINLTALATGDGSSLTNIALYPSLSNNAGLVLAVATNETGVEWVAVSNTVSDASTLTNFPASILQTNSSVELFPAGLLRTDGSAASLTDFPTLNQNTTGTAANVTGVVAITNGGTGTNSAAGARINLLPSYIGNSNKVLAVNAGETDAEWVTQAGGTPDVSAATGVLAVANGGTGATNAATALTNLTILKATNSILIGQSSTNNGPSNVVVGALANITNSFVDNSVAIGFSARATSDFTVAVGSSSIAGGGTNAIAIGRSSQANAPGAIQLGEGSNGVSNTIQFLSAGTIDSDEWSRLAALSTYPTTNISVVGTNNTNTLVFSNGILVEVQ